MKPAGCWEVVEHRKQGVAEKAWRGLPAAKREQLTVVALDMWPAS